MNPLVKKILISLGAVIIVAGVAFGVLLALGGGNTNEQAGPVSTVDPGQVDTSKDYGACELLTTATIKRTLGEPAAQLQDPGNLGRVYIGSQFGEQLAGDESQSCVYSFIEGGTFENGFNGQHGLTVEVYVHGTPESREAFVAAIATEPGVKVGTLDGDDTFFISSEVIEPAGTRYSFTRVADQTHYRLSIAEPVGSETFSAVSAKEALTTLARELSR